jgi:prepilin-type N-terminal cleavage/methylation domain-containing protein
MKSERGFTLVEVLVALAIGMLMLTAIYGAVDMGQRSSTGIERKVIAQQDARTVLGLMAMEIRMASYNPGLIAGIWVNPANCVSSPVGSTQYPSYRNTYQGIIDATPNSLIIEMDVDGSAIVGDSGNEIISYAYDQANQYIWRETRRQGTCVQNRQPLLGATTAGGEPKTVLVTNDINNDGAYSEGIDIPVFRYYDGNGAEILQASLSTQIDRIRRIEITLVVDTADADPNLSRATNQGRRRLIYSTSVIPMNHLSGKY